MEKNLTGKAIDLPPDLRKMLERISRVVRKRCDATRMHHIGVIVQPLLAVLDESGSSEAFGQLAEALHMTKGELMDCAFFAEIWGESFTLFSSSDHIRKLISSLICLGVNKMATNYWALLETRRKGITPLQMDTQRASKSCPACKSKPNGLHASGCDVEQCPECGWQLLTCWCPRKHDAIPPENRMPWTGDWPNVAQCREYGLWCTRYGLVQCDSTHLEAMPDITRLLNEGEWDKSSRKWIIKGRETNEGSSPQ